MRRWLLFVLFCASFSVQATGQQDFNAGISAFKKGQYPTAARYFEKARAAGMNIPALDYNLGVSYYKLGQYEQANTAFKRASKIESMAPLAYYNLGLVSKKTGDLSRAESWFSKSLQTTQDEKLRILASRALNNIDKLKKQKPRKRWNGYIAASLGYDDNVTLDNDALIATSAQSDSFYELYAYTRGLLIGSPKSGLYFKGSAFADFYQTLNQFDYVDANAGLFQTFAIQRWRNEAGLYATYSTLGGNSYLRSASFSFTSRKKLSPSARIRLKLRLRNIESIDSRYTYLDGTSHDLRLEGRWRPGKQGSLRAYYQLQVNDRKDRTTATTFTSFSPSRHRLRADYTIKLATTWSSRIAAEFRNSQYDDANIESNGDVIKREDNRLRGLLEVSKKFTRKTSTSLTYTYTDNDSNIERYTYQRNVVMANLQFLF